jgi:hypothetical protein
VPLVDDIWHVILRGPIDSARATDVSRASGDKGADKLISSDKSL